MNAHAGTGIALSIAANRLSFLLDLHGPSMAIDTACSSLLVAVHQACESLWHGDTHLALAGGVDLILLPDLNIIFSQAGMMADDGRYKVNPYIPLEAMPLAIPTTRSPWPAWAQRRLAGVGSFGFGGTNAHILLEQAPAPSGITGGDVERPLHILDVSAQRPSALRAVAEPFARSIEAHPDQ